MVSVPSAEAKKPLLFFVSFPGEGHLNPVLRIASSMIQRGYDVAFLGSRGYQDRIRDAGAEFFDMKWDMALAQAESMTAVVGLPPGPERLAVQLVHVFYKDLHKRVQALSDTLAHLRAREPKRQIICVEDVVNMGTMPFRYGRPLPAGFDERPRSIGISPTPLMAQSRDTAPFMLGLPPDSTESGRRRNEALNRLAIEGSLKPMTEAWTEALRACGCSAEPSGNPFDAWYTVNDACFLLCSPSLEYHRSDLSASVQFAGCLPRKDTGASFEYPPWWPEVVGSGRGTGGEARKVVFVSQGTVNNDWRQLLLPTLAALADRSDVIVVAALGYRGARLDEGVSVPSNARVSDYVPYDAILPHADVFVSNAGYGAFCHAVMNGVPSVFAGQTEDKLEVSMRAEWAGFAHNLRTQTPTADELRDGVAKVLADARYKRRALELQRENEAMDCLSRIERQIELLTEP
ncbi:hypothetical protein CDD83_3292 [Cordyceps sp. RAO-2017]|nr:hypothetical protein CDD83_3292 [Cordyceps sp. RAO-2017]